MSLNVHDVKRAASFETTYRILVWSNGEGHGYGRWVETGDRHESYNRAEQALLEYFEENGDEIPTGLYRAEAGEHHAELRFTRGQVAA